jgi:hypothetical protein
MNTITSTMHLLTGRLPVEARVVSTHIVREVARALVAWIGPASRSALVAALGETVVRDAERRPADLAELYDAVQRAAHLSKATAVEVTQIVLGAIGEAIGADARQRLAGELPPPWSDLLEDAHRAAPADRRVGPAIDPTFGHTLATGHPGADAPLFSAGAPAGQADSIAESDDPHGDRKLAGASGPVPRRRTLSEGGG